jgi:predicted transposase YbfD/YdcC
VLGQEAVEGKTNELPAIPVLLEKLAEGGGLKGALVSIDAIATNAKIAQAIKDAGAGYLLAVKANQPSLRAGTQSAFAAACVIRVESRAGLSGRCRFETRYYISSAALDAGRAAEAVRGHWGIENRLHWVLDAVFREDQSRLRKGHGAKNMAVVRHFAINLIRSAKDKRSIRLRRKIAGWDPNYLAELLNLPPR